MSRRVDPRYLVSRGTFPLIKGYLWRHNVDLESSIDNEINKERRKEKIEYTLGSFPLRRDERGEDGSEEEPKEIGEAR